MKPFQILLLSHVVSTSIEVAAQNVSIGTANPSEKLDVNGGVKIGNTNKAPGTMRWNADKSDFEGYNGSTWVSLTGGKNS
jgi:hypothetical protein